MGARIVLCVLSLLSSAKSLSVIQPSATHANIGSSVTLECMYSTSSGSTLGQYQWYKDNVSDNKVSSESREFWGRVYRPAKRSFQEEQKADIELRDVRSYDAGIYICEVELLAEGKARGNGTRLHVSANVTDGAANGGTQSVVFVLLLRAVCYAFGLILSALASIIYYWHKEP
ncbi:natural cytotoxicity triggering receptor 3-like [Lissotriton helveticus]